MKAILAFFIGIFSLFGHTNNTLPASQNISTSSTPKILINLNPTTQEVTSTTTVESTTQSNTGSESSGVGISNSISNDGTITNTGNGWELFTNQKYGFDISAPIDLYTEYMFDTYLPSGGVRNTQYPLTNPLISVNNSQLPKLSYLVIPPTPSQYAKVIPQIPTGTTMITVVGQNVPLLMSPNSSGRTNISFTINLSSGNQLEVIMTGVSETDLQNYTDIIKQIAASIKVS
jgi:hypothetical protein